MKLTLCVFLLFGIVTLTPAALDQSPTQKSVEKGSIDTVPRWADVIAFLRSKPTLKEIKKKFGEPKRVHEAGDNMVLVYYRREPANFPDAKDTIGVSCQLRKGKLETYGAITFSVD